MINSVVFKFNCSVCCLFWCWACVVYMKKIQNIYDCGIMWSFEVNEICTGVLLVYLCLEACNLGLDIVESVPSQHLVVLSTSVIAIQSSEVLCFIGVWGLPEKWLVLMCLIIFLTITELLFSKVPDVLHSLQNLQHKLHFQQYNVYFGYIKVTAVSFIGEENQNYPEKTTSLPQVTENINCIKLKYKM